MDIVIPSLGDIEEVEVIELCVAPGDTVEENDTILVIESDKASMDVPAPAAGTIESIVVAVGDMVGEGAVIATFSSDAGAGDASEAPASEPAAAEAAMAEDTPAEDAAEEAPSASSSSASPATSQEVEVLVPDIGDASGVVVIEIAVSAGAQVDVDDLLIVLESDKASMEIAAEHAGEVLSVAVEEGQEVGEGTLIATLKVTGGAESAEVSAPVKTPDPKPDPAPQPATSTAPAPTEPAQSASDAVDRQSSQPASQVYAGPAVRRLSRELGVDLTQVTGTGNRNRITKDDVKAYVKTRMNQPAATAGGGIPPVPEVDFSKFGAVELAPLTRIQQRGADNLHRSWINLPHVTQHDEADITDMEAFRSGLKAEAERKGVRVTPLSFLVKACCSALQEYPIFNSSLHTDGKQLHIKQYINIGMAVDTPDGLVVPVIKDADKKSIWTLSEEIAELSEKARNRKLGMDDMQGGTFSISSLGALGGTGFTPIVNAPEVAILGVAKLQTKPVWDGDAFVPRKMLPLSLSYDHRVINGADGGRFMVYLTQVLGDIRRLAL
ncbi:MAG: dihydrolipoyllysine-residue acetyltransferase [Pseudomonadota bacterium]